MTEQQIENLKQLLSNSETPDSPSELDNKVLKAARLYSQEVNNTREKNFLSRIFNAFSPLGKLSAGALSVLLTAAIFLGMNQIIKVDSEFQTTEGLLATSDDGKIELEIIAKESTTNRTISESNLGKPKFEPKIVGTKTEQAPQRLSARDQILAEMKLPNTAEILASLKFDIQQDRKLAEASINIAMTDIRPLIGVGHLSKARQRYAELRTMCAHCTLPDTLEMLVIDANKNSTLNSS